jgi:hypothetical protein
MPQPNAIHMQRYLSGVKYPCSRNDLIEHARGKGADDKILEHLEALPDRTYEGPNAVSAEYIRT